MIDKIKTDMLKVKRMVEDVEIVIGKREGESKLVNKLIDAENLLTYCMSRLENAIIPPCKVGDTVYDRFGNPITIRGVGIDYVFKGTHDISDISAGYPFSVRKSISLPVEFRYIDFGEIVFLTKEEAAEKALKERENNA